MSIHRLQAKRNRQGVTLLFVVSMIVLLMLLATTFLVISSQYLRGAKSFAKSEIFGGQPQSELDQVLYMLLRDSRDPSNPLRTHSLLADMYGYNSIIRGSVNAGSAQHVFGSDRAFIQIAVNNNSTSGLDGNSKLLSPNKNSHLGQLLTVTNGGMQGITSRIVGHVYDATSGIHYLRLFPYLDNFLTDASDLLLALNSGPEFIVNGRPFDGTGAGFNENSNYEANDSLTGQLHQPRLTDQAWEPNRSGETESQLIANYVRFGDVNEDYDAPDYQNCFLAAEVPSLNPDGSYSVTVLPSFHRQALVSDRRLANSGTILPKTMFRPYLSLGNPGSSKASSDFPQLTGLGLSTQSNGGFGLGAIDPVTGNRRFDWDVDNDRDGINDSVWVDPNLPVVTHSSGRTYKRLYAILCRDMDGRFNLNAHSNRWHLDSGYTENLNVTNPPLVADENNPALGSTLSTVASSDGGLTSFLPRGQGYGPGEINMRTLLPTGDLQRLMYGVNAARLWGRNGHDSGQPFPKPGVPLPLIDQPTLMNLYDMSQGAPEIFGGAYGTYPDIHGRMTFGLDFNGLPSFSLTTAGNELHENEYERNVNDPFIAGLASEKVVAVSTQVDAPYSFAEIESILRGNDNDSSTLPNRILQLAPNAFDNLDTATTRGQSAFNRMHFGGHSYEVPSIPLDFVDEFRQAMISANAYIGVTDPLARVALIDEDLEEMLPAELFNGMPLDVNRIFGDGEDTNRDKLIVPPNPIFDFYPDFLKNIDYGVMDNHWGIWSRDLEDNPALLDNISESQFPEMASLNRSLDLDNDGLIGNVDFDEHLVRYENAKYLYVMMRMILRTSGLDPVAPAATAVRSRVTGGQDLDGNGTPNEANDLAIFVAQWAINAVDFRDKDSIMTPFEFDLNPFDGWHVDGNPAYQDALRDGRNIPIDDGTGPTIQVNHRGSTYTATAEQTPYVVFGLEKPSLLMTETLAFHDRRTQDTDDDTPDQGMPNPPGKAKGLGKGKKKGKGKNPDNDNDQRLEPLGATFIEIYNPEFVSGVRTADLYSLPNEAAGYNTVVNNGIDLRRLSLTPGVRDPAGNVVASKPAPVWRIVATRDDIDLDLRDSVNNQFLNRDQIERVIYFVVEDNGDMTVDPAEYQKSELRYDLPPKVLEKNGMFLLSRQTLNAMSPLTGLSSAVIATAAIPIQNANPPAYIIPLGRRTDVTDDIADVKYNLTRNVTISRGVSANAVIVNEPNQAGSTLQSYPKTTMAIPIEDLNISKPIGDYEFSGQTRGTITVQDAGGGGRRYTETSYLDVAGDPYVFDAPLDRNYRPDADPGTPNEYDNFPRNANQSIQSYRILHLQRLANPLAGWHPRSNPYLTVDSMPIDLSVFDGLDPSDLNPAFTNTVGFGTKERGEASLASTERNLWTTEPDRNQSQMNGAAPAHHRFRYYLENPNTPQEEESLGHSKASRVINFSYELTNYPANRSTHASLAWNNRPFVSPYELMLVPHTSSSQLLRRFRSNNPTGPNVNYRWDAESISNGYTHLLNFFQSSDTAPPTGGTTNRYGPDFCRMLDYVHVPSRFGFTNTYLNPQTFGSATAPDQFLDLDEALGNQDSPSLFDSKDPGFRAPSNLIRDRREPGKVNLNTIMSQPIWSGVNGGLVGRGGHDSAGWDQFRNSRRGNQVGNVLDAIAGPTFFPRPFRNSTAGNLVPNHPNPLLDVVSPVANSLLRKGEVPQTVDVAPPLLRGDHPSVNSNRHPLLRFLPRSRLENLTTTQSNVFAVWITVGYFEYDENTGRLGQEIGSSGGETDRHRAFYMIDRSIPVGFEPGKNHNVDKTIMLRRYIE